MKTTRVDVTSSGVVILGRDVSCDGFHYDYPVRVQTHVHTDHMDDFATSKGLQDILLSDATFEFLVVELDAELPIRSNIRRLPFEDVHDIRSSRLSLLPAGHMLGSAQVAVELDDGTRVGYSGDFAWPLDKVIRVDQLVVDSTYGSPTSVRRYSQEDAEGQLLAIARRKLAKGPLNIRAHRGTVHRGLHVLSQLGDCPFLVSPRMFAEIEVYRRFGYPIDEVSVMGSSEAREASETGRFVRFYGTGDRFPIDPLSGTTITLSAFMAGPDDPVLEYTERALSIALSDHADFLGTLDYIRETGARIVITDNSRGGHAIELANEVSRRLGVEAVASKYEPSYKWGD